jgi:hypothetical protein
MKWCLELFEFQSLFIQEGTNLGFCQSIFLLLF